MIPNGQYIEDIDLPVANALVIAVRPPEGVGLQFTAEDIVADGEYIKQIDFAVSVNITLGFPRFGGGG